MVQYVLIQEIQNEVKQSFNALSAHNPILGIHSISLRSWLPDTYKMQAALIQLANFKHLKIYNTIIP